MDALRFFHIGKANAEIERLTKRVAELEGQISDYKTSADSCSVALEKAAVDCAAATKSVSDISARLEASESEVKELTAENSRLTGIIADPAGEIEKRASAKALELAAGQGIPIVLAPSATHSSGETLDDVRRQILAETDPVKLYQLSAKARDLRGHKDIFNRN